MFLKKKHEWFLLSDDQKPVPCIIANNPNITAGAIVSCTEQKLITIA